MKYVRIIILVLWMIIMFDFSQDNGEVSTNKSDSFIKQVYEVVCKITHQEVTPEKIEQFTNNTFVIVRKAAHIIEYFVLSILLMSVIKDWLHKKEFILGFSISLIYAISDEIHQLFISGRSGSIIDIFIDLIGIVLGIGIYYLIYKRRKEKYN